MGACLGKRNNTNDMCYYNMEHYNASDSGNENGYYFTTPFFPQSDTPSSKPLHFTNQIGNQINFQTDSGTNVQLTNSTIDGLISEEYY